MMLPRITRATAPYVNERDARAARGQAQRAGTAQAARPEHQGRPAVEHEPVRHWAYPHKSRLSDDESYFLQT
jgi:hypothetical protein